MRDPLGCSPEFSVIRSWLVIPAFIWALGCDARSPAERAAWATARAFVVAIQQADSAMLARLGRSGDPRQTLCVARHWPVDVTGRNSAVPELALVRDEGADSLWVFVALGAPKSAPDSVREGYGLAIARQDSSRVSYVYRIRASAPDTALAICLRKARAA
jgi:hypothetical protein